MSKNSFPCDRLGREILTGLATFAMFSCIGGTATAGVTRLHPGDKISINVYNHPELSTQPLQPTVVDANGRIWVPVAGLIDTSNLTPIELAQKIDARLSSYVRHPACDVELVAEAQSIFVTGAASGVFPFTPGETLPEVLSQVQASVTPTAANPTTGVIDPSQVAAHQLMTGSIDLRHVVIERDGANLPMIDASALIASGQPGPSLQPDDTIELAYKPIAVRVSGDVRQPGIAHLDSDEPLSDALRQVGQPDDTTAADTFDLTRDGTQTLVDSSSPQYRTPAQNGDVVFVPTGVHVGVVGQVTTPGRVLLQGDHSLLSALYYAGGPTKYGDIRHVKLLHDGQQSELDVTKLTHGGADQNPMLADGDTVFVPEGHRIDFVELFTGIIAASYLHVFF